MNEAVAMVEIWRGGMLESLHRGHAVVCDSGGAVVAAWGDPEKIIFPRSSCKILQALPLVESGAAKAAGLGSEQLALACASHRGATMHTEPVERWLNGIGKSESDLRCGSHPPAAAADRFRLHDAGQQPCQLHNNCSGKHAGFVTLAAHLGAGAEYVELGHPVQIAVKQAFEEVTGEASAGYGIDGCSAPNFACSLKGLAYAMARMGRPTGLGKLREAAAMALVKAMIQHPKLVEGDGGADTELMEAVTGAVVKNGADGVYVAILPKLGLGVALKIEDGAARAKEAAIAALLVRMGVLDRQHPAAQTRLNAPIRNWRGIETGRVKAASALNESWQS